jgi:hypothetical protein
MHSIYARSHVTTVVLSKLLNSTAETKALIRFSGSELLEKKNLRKSMDLLPACLSAFQHMLSDSYFTRVWTFQEQNHGSSKFILVPVRPVIGICNQNHGSGSVWISVNTIKNIQQWCGRIMAKPTPLWDSSWAAVAPSSKPETSYWYQDSARDPSMLEQLRLLLS